MPFMAQAGRQRRLIDYQVSTEENMSPLKKITQRGRVTRVEIPYISLSLRFFRKLIIIFAGIVMADRLSGRRAKL